MKIKVNIIVLFGFLFLFSSCGTSKSVHHKPDLEGYNAMLPVVVKGSNTFYNSGKNFLAKNRQNLWELYVEGDPLERGLVMGALTDSLLKKQERVFFTKIKEMVPSKKRQKLLRSFLKWYNRKLYLNVTNEYQTEIYGISKYTSDEWNYIAPPYLRSLYLHGSHDIGHVLQDLALVGCTSFAAWGDKSEDGSLIIGRNCDFYAGDEFAKDKIVAFVNPTDGHSFMMVTWPGMIGAISGMNMEGLTVTINAAKSKIPLIAKTPISILSREILQYASNIDEAIVIAKKRKVFVSESIMIGSAKDKKAVIIEVSPHRVGVYNVTNSNEIVCSNHFQSPELKGDKRNRFQIVNGHTQYRYDRMQQLISENPKINPEIAVSILRNREGLNNLAIGYGNEKSLNQMLAHHSVVFKPEQRLVWVSANPYQLGEFVCYDLNEVFKNRKENQEIVSLQNDKLDIPLDHFLNTKEYQNYEDYRIADRLLSIDLKNKTILPDEYIKKYQSLNPEYWGVYYRIGLYHYQHKEYQLAQKQFETALTKEITTVQDKEQIEKYLKKIKRKLQ